MLKYYRVWEERFDDRKNWPAMAQCIAHLRYIRTEEAKQLLEASGMKKQI